MHGVTDESHWRVTLAETGIDAMTGCRLKRVERYLTGDRFMLTYGDGVTDLDVGRLVEFHRTHGKLATVTAVRPPSRFGELQLDGPNVVEFLEKPLTSPGSISGGFFVFERAFLDRLVDQPSLVLEHHPLVQLAADGELMAYRHDGFWHAMDNSRDYHHLNRLWAAGEAPWNTWDFPRLRRAA
jgi:glucose-1-phosphate cytidylyltransferase